MINGLALSFTNSPLLQALVRGLFSSYHAVTWPWTVRVYEEMVETWKEDQIRHTPILYFYCYSDPMCDATKMEDLLTKQRQAGLTVLSKWWYESEHVQHVKWHREEYLSELSHFLSLVDPTNRRLHQSKL